MSIEIRRVETGSDLKTFIQNHFIYFQHLYFEIDTQLKLYFNINVVIRKITKYYILITYSINVKKELTWWRNGGINF